MWNENDEICSIQNESDSRLNLKTKTILHPFDTIIVSQLAQKISSSRSESSNRLQQFVIAKQSLINTIYKLRFQNSKMLIFIEISYLLLNLPFFAGVLLTALYYRELTASSQQHQSRIQMDLAALNERLRFYSFLNIAEILKVLNFSLTGTLFLLSTKLFRLHFLNLIFK